MNPYNSLNPYNGLQYLSLLSTISAAHALYHGFVIGGLLLCMQTLISFSYWNSPKHGIIRNIDIAITFINFCFFMKQWPIAILFLLPLCVLSYIEDHIIYRPEISKKLWKILHIAVFIFVNFIIWKKAQCGNCI
jgi:hypothetical protein